MTLPDITTHSEGTDVPDAAELAERALAVATEPCIVLVGVNGTVNLRWAANTLTTNGLTGSHDVTVVSMPGGNRTASVSRSGVGAGDLAALVAEAEASARDAAPAQDAAELVAGAAADDFAEAPPHITADVLGQFAEHLGSALGEARGSATELFGYAEQTGHTTYLAASTGTRVRHHQSTATVQVNGKAEQRTRSAWAGSAAQTLDEVDVAAMTSEVAEQLGWQARHLELPAGRYDTVLPPSAVADLMTYTYWSSDARSAHEGRSAFGHPGGGTRVGERVTEVPLSLVSDPAMAGLAASATVMTGSSHPMASVFDNGLPIGRTAWIDGGQLAALPTTRHSAQLAGLATTPPADNLRLDVAGATGGMAELVSGLDDGLLLTCLWYIREVDPQTLLLTGLTRDGVYRVRRGEVVGAVTNYRFNESPLDLLGRITGASGTVPTLGREFGDYFPRTAMPALRVSGFNYSSVSQAS
ncbi:MAG: metallopeptidase TldD-related protein [Angustibacter sp.]